MGLTVPFLRAMRQCLPAKRVLSLGYPDIVATRDEIRAEFGVDVEGQNPVGKWHGVDYPLPETGEFFAKLGSTLDCVDIVASRGVERIVDLNHPYDLGEYDLVIDGGTVEHCFMAGQAILNAANAVKVGGWIMHGNPVSMVNHGFWNVSPTLYADFYRQNGWRVEQMVCMDREGEQAPIPETARCIVAPECTLLCVAQRVTDAGLKFPVQTKYLKNPTLGAA